MAGFAITGFFTPSYQSDVLGLMCVCTTFYFVYHMFNPAEIQCLAEKIMTSMSINTVKQGNDDRAKND